MHVAVMCVHAYVYTSSTHFISPRSVAVVGSRCVNMDSTGVSTKSTDRNSPTSSSPEYTRSWGLETLLLGSNSTVWSSGYKMRTVAMEGMTSDDGVEECRVEGGRRRDSLLRWTHTFRAEREEVIRWDTKRRQNRMDANAPVTMAM